MRYLIAILGIFAGPLMAQSNPSAQPPGAEQPAEEGLEGVLDETATDLDATVENMVSDGTTTVVFERGSSIVNNDYRAAIESTVRNAYNDGPVKRIIVAAWGDETLKDPEAELSDDQMMLGHDRVESVRAILSAYGVNTVKTFNMAESPGWFARTFNLEEAKLKGTLRGSTESDAEFVSLANTLRDKGGPMKAVLFVERDSTGSE